MKTTTFANFVIGAYLAFTVTMGISTGAEVGLHVLGRFQSFLCLHLLLCGKVGLVHF